MADTPTPSGWNLEPGNGRNSPRFPRNPRLILAFVAAAVVVLVVVLVAVIHTLSTRSTNLPVLLGCKVGSMDELQGMPVSVEQLPRNLRALTATVDKAGDRKLRVSVAFAGPIPLPPDRVYSSYTRGFVDQPDTDSIALSVFLDGNNRERSFDVEHAEYTGGGQDARWIGITGGKETGELSASVSIVGRTLTAVVSLPDAVPTAIDGKKIEVVVNSQHNLNTLTPTPSNLGIAFYPIQPCGSAATAAAAASSVAAPPSNSSSSVAEARAMESCSDARAIAVDADTGDDLVCTPSSQGTGSVWQKSAPISGETHTVGEPCDPAVDILARDLDGKAILCSGSQWTDTP